MSSQKKQLTYLTTVDGVDFLEFHASLFHYFYTPMAKYERLVTRCIRETMAFLRGGYHVVYMSREDRLLGYGIVSKGGGRNAFCTAADGVFCSLWVQPEERGKGYSNTLIKGLLSCFEKQYADFYEYIRQDNVPSVKAAEANGFRCIGRAEYSGILKKIRADQNGHLGIYRKKQEQKS